MGDRRTTLILGKQLSQKLHDLAKLEGRTLQGQVLYLLEVMVALANRNPKFRLRPELLEPVVQNLGFKVDFPEWLEDQLFHLAGLYGLKKQELMRTFLWMGMGYLESFGSGQLIRKEELVGLVEESTKPSMVH